MITKSSGSSQSKASKTAKELPNKSSANSNGQEELNNSQEPRSFRQAFINMFPRNFFSVLFGFMVISCTIYALVTGNTALLWSVWVSVGIAVGIAPRAKQGLQWAKDHYELQAKNPSDTSLIE